MKLQREVGIQSIVIVLYVTAQYVTLYSVVLSCSVTIHYVK